MGIPGSRTLGEQMDGGQGTVQLGADDRVVQSSQLGREARLPKRNPKGTRLLGARCLF